MTFSKEEKGFLIQLVSDQQKKIKIHEKRPDDFFDSFADEVRVDEFITGLLDKLKKL